MEWQLIFCRKDALNLVRCSIAEHLESSIDTGILEAHLMGS